MSNAIYTITPKKKNKVWAFTDEARGLVEEPFVAGADTFIDILAQGKKKLDLIFSAKPFPGHQVQLSFKEGKVSEGTYYTANGYNHELWLCPALGKYFKRSPKNIYVQVKL
jgi:hypothetical protein